MAISASFLHAMDYGSAKGWRELNELRLLVAATQGSLATAKYLVAAGVNVNCVGKESAGEYVGESPLGCALKNGHMAVCDYLVGEGADKSLVSE